MELTSTPAPKRPRGRPRKYARTAPKTAEAEANAVVRAATNVDIEDLDKLAELITRRLRSTIDVQSSRLPVTEVMLVTTQQAAQSLSVSEGTIFNLIRDGRLNAIKINGTRRIALDELRRLASVGTK